MAVGCLNGNWKSQWRELREEYPYRVLMTLERIAAKVKIAQGLQEQYDRPDIVEKGNELEMDCLHELVDICRNNPKHIEYSTKQNA